MPSLISEVKLTDLAHKDNPNEIFLSTLDNTTIHIVQYKDCTVITFPYNDFEIIQRKIIIKD